MAALNFPNSPSVNDVYTSGTVSFKWDGTVWNSYKTAANTPILSSYIDGKGGLITGSAADTPASLSAGTTGFVLTADDNEPIGVKWSPAAADAIPQLFMMMGA